MTNDRRSRAVRRGAVILMMPAGALSRVALLFLLTANAEALVVSARPHVRFTRVVRAGTPCAHRAPAPRMVLGGSSGLVFPNEAMPTAVATAVALNSILAAIGVMKGQKMLTPSGLIHAWALGVILWSTLGPTGWGLCVVYLIAGSVVTKVGKAEKESLGIAEGRGGARGPENVWGSAAAGTLCALARCFLPNFSMTLQVGYVASLATKLSDTFASEIGKAYGKTAYLITTLKQVPRGTEGAVSLEGTLAGVAGSILIAGVAFAMNLCGPLGVALAIIAAFVATNCESLIGATLQGRFGWLTNEVVNFINTAIGATVAMGLRTLLLLRAG